MEYIIFKDGQILCIAQEECFTEELRKLLIKRHQPSKLTYATLGRIKELTIKKEEF